MIDESLIKSNFVGRDGFRWWIGQIPPESAHGNQINGGGWGNRFKVRIMGYHPYNTVDLPNEDLPWAQVLLSTTSGTGAGNQATSVKISPGDVVFGFFLDGDNAQIPVIIGCFGRTNQVPDSQSSGPFVPFTGYTDKIKKPNGTLKADQSNQQNADSQKSPRMVSPDQAKAIGSDEISFYSAIGDSIQFANTANNTLVGKISSEVNNLLNKVKTPAIFTNITNEINRVVKKVQAISNGLVGNMMNGLYKGLIPVLQKGLDLLYKKVYAIVLAATQNPGVAHLAGVAAQTAMVAPINFLEKQLGTIPGNILSSLGLSVRQILSSTVQNVQNFNTCAGNQFTGALVNDVISKVSSGLSNAISGVGNILQFFSSFSVDNFFRTSSDSIKGLIGLFDTNQSKDKASGIVDQWIIGKGVIGAAGPDFNQILQSANIAKGISNNLLDGFDIFKDSTRNPRNVSPLGGCYTGPPINCESPQIKIFGGGGTGAAAIALLGAVVGEGSGRTGSVIGAKVLNGGSGYEFPPFVEIVDNCNRGYGAIARSVINDKGEVIKIYIVSEGENYPIGETPNYIVSDILVQDPGEGYLARDKAVDQFGNEYKVEVFEGVILRAEPINKDNVVEVNDLPILTVLSDTGNGAILRPVLDVRPEFQGEVIQSIDCIGK
jgi:hypothetical protein